MTEKFRLKTILTKKERHSNLHCLYDRPASLNLIFYGFSSWPSSYMFLWRQDKNDKIWLSITVRIWILVWSITMFYQYSLYNMWTCYKQKDGNTKKWVRISYAMQANQVRISRLKINHILINNLLKLMDLYR